MEAALHKLQFNSSHVGATGLALQEDSSLTRSNAYMLQLFARAQMQIVLNVQQRKFPKDLFKVRMYVVRPLVSC